MLVTHPLNEIETQGLRLVEGLQAENRPITAENLARLVAKNLPEMRKLMVPEKWLKRLVTKGYLTQTGRGKEALFAMREVAADNTPQDIVKLQFPADVAYSLVAHYPETQLSTRLKQILGWIQQYTIAGYGKNYRDVDCWLMLFESGHTKSLNKNGGTSNLRNNKLIHRAANGELVIGPDGEGTAEQRAEALQNPPEGNQLRVFRLLEAGQEQGKGLFDAAALNACDAAKEHQYRLEHSLFITWKSARVQDAELAELAELGFLNVHPPEIIEFEVLPAPERDRTAAARKGAKKSPKGPPALNIQHGTQVLANMEATTVISQASFATQKADADQISKCVVKIDCPTTYMLSGNSETNLITDPNQLQLIEIIRSYTEDQNGIGLTPNDLFSSLKQSGNCLDRGKENINHILTNLNNRGFVKKLPKTTA